MPFGPEVLNELIAKAIKVRGWTREHAEAEAWAWLAKASGVKVRWPEMTLTQRWEAEAALEKNAAAKPVKRSKRPAGLPLSASLEAAKRQTEDFLYAHRDDAPDAVLSAWWSAVAEELERIETPGFSFDLHQAG